MLPIRNLLISLTGLSLIAWSLITNPPTLRNNASPIKRLLLDASTGNQTEAKATFFNQQLRHVRQQAPASSVHCIGEMYGEQSFVYRSCSFRNLCFNVTSKNFVLIESNQTQKIQQLLRKISHPVSISTNWDTALALSPVNKEFWSPDDFNRVKWFPDRAIQSTLDKEKGYYQLDSGVVMVPFLLYGASNPGHVVWDNFIPIYKLLTMFGLMWNEELDGIAQPKSKQALLLHFELEKQLFGMCYRPKERAECHAMIRKLLPIMGLSDDNLGSTNNGTIQLSSNAEAGPLSDLVCAKNGAAGIGMLSDHGLKGNGQLVEDIPSFHNNGKGDLVFQFRNFALQKMGLKSNDKYLLQQDLPFRVTISTNSSRASKRILDFEPYKIAIEKAFDPSKLAVEMYELKKIPLRQQMRIATETLFYFSACGGSVVTATFLPRGASLILFYSIMRGPTRPARLDFDLLNNLPYVRVHWFPRTPMHKPDVVRSIILLMEAEMEALANRRIVGVPLIQQQLPSIQA